MQPEKRDTIYAFSGGLLGPSQQARRIRRILALSGRALRFGWPNPDDKIAVWGHAKRAARGAWVSARSGAGLIRLEDAFLRSLFPGRAGEPTLGLLLDHSGIHYNPAQPSDLETLLASHRLDDPDLLARARLGIARMRAGRLTKYAAFAPDLPPPAPGYVLVIDQTRGDASLRHGGMSGPLASDIFQTMLARACADFPESPIVIRTHPETQAGHRAGHYSAADAKAGRITLLHDPVSSWDLLEGAVAVYTVCSQLGFEAILAGHRP
ncbi:MAG: capsular polysaccharide biosynthesis protein, partial [Roseinatronobacter sp.]|nr:capsular polysaccharide biosynthesis protein [Roseinatronobacter sp.]